MLSIAKGSTSATGVTQARNKRYRYGQHAYGYGVTNAQTAGDIIVTSKETHNNNATNANDTSTNGVTHARNKRYAAAKTPTATAWRIRKQQALRSLTARRIREQNGLSIATANDTSINGLTYARNKWCGYFQNHAYKMARRMRETNGVMYRFGQEHADECAKHKCHQALRPRPRRRKRRAAHAKPKYLTIATVLPRRLSKT